MQLFEHLDNALVQIENHNSYVARSAAAWPSEASAELFDDLEAPVVGKCHRASFWRMIGEPVTNPIDPIGARRFRVGKAIEEDIKKCAQVAGIFVASGVKFYVADIDLSLELDLVLIDPETKQAVIGECKSIYGYYAASEVIKNGRPKLDAVMQATMYVNEFRTGAAIKEAIAACLKQRDKLQARVEQLRTELNAMMLPTYLCGQPAPKEVIDAKLKEVEAAKSKAARYRIEVDYDNLAKLSDGPTAAKLAYETRDDCQTKEFDVQVWTDPFDGLHYPMIDGEPYRIFTVESVYERYKILQKHYLKAVAWVEKELGDTAGEKGTEAYWAKVGQKLRDLPLDLLPKAEYEFKYGAEKIEALFKAGKIGKTKYEGWKKKHKGKTHIGSWRCSYCSFLKRCLPLEYPEYQYLALELDNDEAA